MRNTSRVKYERNYQAESMMMDEAWNYFWMWNKRFKLNLMYTVICNVDENDDKEKDRKNWLAYYHRDWVTGECKEKGIADKKYRFGSIAIYQERFCKLTREERFETIRHEIAHALADIRYGYNNESHGPNWIRIGKLLRVNVNPYLKCNNCK